VPKPPNAVPISNKWTFVRNLDKEGKIVRYREASVSVTHDPQFHARSKHIAKRHHWVRDLVNNEVLDIQNCRDPKQTADVLAKPLPKPKPARHTDEMGVQLTDITR
jgi:hypothetical protein